MERFSTDLGNVFSHVRGFVHNGDYPGPAQPVWPVEGEDSVPYPGDPTPPPITAGSL